MAPELGQLAGPALAAGSGWNHGRMPQRSPDTYRAVAEAAWRWVLDQVRWDDGPWIPVSVTTPAVTEASWDRDGLHSGVGGLAHVLAEIRSVRPWTAEEQRLGDGIAERLRRAIPAQTDCTYFDGLVSSLGALIALQAPGADEAVARLAVLAAPGGWPQRVVGEPRYLPDAHVQDLTLGTAGVLLGALWARRHGVAAAGDVAGTAADVLLSEAERLPTGLDWQMVPRRYLAGPPGAASVARRATASSAPGAWRATRAPRELTSPSK